MAHSRTAHDRATALLRHQAEGLNMVSLELSNVSELVCKAEPTEATPDDMRREALELLSFSKRLLEAAGVLQFEAGRLQGLVFAVESSLSEAPVGAEA